MRRAILILCMLAACADPESMEVADSGVIAPVEDASVVPDAATRMSMESSNFVLCQGSPPNSS